MGKNMTFDTWCDFHFGASAKRNAIAARLGIAESTVTAFRNLERFPSPEMAERLDAHSAGLIDFDAWRRDYVRAQARRRKAKKEAATC